MKNTQQKSNTPYLLLNMSMIALETFYSFILNHDDVVKKHAQTFIDQKTVIKINSYIPYVNFYVQFTSQGLLFDVEQPEQSVQLEMSSTLFGYIQAFLLGNKRSIRHIKIYGDSAQKDQLRDLITQMAFPHLLIDWKKWLFRPRTEDVTTHKKRVAPLLEKIEFQRTRINHLQIEVKKQNNRIKNMKQKQKILNITFVLIIMILTSLLIYNYWINL